MQYDVILAHKRSAPGHIVVTVANEGSAIRLVETLSKIDLWQCEGLIAFYREVDRGPTEEPEPEYYSLNSDEVIAQIRLSDDVEELDGIHAVERAHPRFPTGRTGVMKAISERLNVLHDDDVDDDANGDDPVS